MSVAAAAAVWPAIAVGQTIDSGDTAWMLTSTALVLFMTLPGLALFYAGLVRRRIAVSTVAAVRPIGVSIVARASATRARRDVTRHRSDQVGLAATSRWGSRPGRPLCVVLNYRVRRMRNTAVISRRENNGIRE